MARRPIRMLEPGGLLLIVAVLTAALVVGALAAASYVLSLRGAPRTAEQRDLGVAKSAVEAAPEDPAAWAELARVYARAGDKRQALGTLDEARAVQEASVLDTALGDVYFLSEDYADAISAYSSAVELAIAEFDDLVNAYQARGILMTEPNQALAAALYGRASAYAALGEDDEAIEDLVAWLEEIPTDASVRVFLGDLYARTGRIDDARAEYEEALRYVPDLTGALVGLEALEAGK